jgi:hypothetical protein
VNRDGIRRQDFRENGERVRETGHIRDTPWNAPSLELEDVDAIEVGGIGELLLGQLTIAATGLEEVQHPSDSFTGAVRTRQRAAHRQVILSLQAARKIRTRGLSAGLKTRQRLRAASALFVESITPQPS